jgi:predicted dinucleotide-binding enzyme
VRYKIGILGTGVVGTTLGKGLIQKGHSVFLGAREANNEKAVKWASENGANAKHGTFEDAVKFGVSKTI